MKLNLDKDENGNSIQEKLIVDDKFLSLDETSQIQKLSKWLYEQSKTVLLLLGIKNAFNKKTSDNESNKKSNPIVKKIYYQFPVFFLVVLVYIVLLYINGLPASCNFLPWVVSLFGG